MVYCLSTILEYPEQLLDDEIFQDFTLYKENPPTNTDDKAETLIEVEENKLTSNLMSNFWSAYDLLNEMNVKKIQKAIEASKNF